MQTSKFIKVDNNILIEYVYTSSNLISEEYKILVNIQDTKQSFISGDSSVTKNIQKNTLFEIDPIEREYGVINTDTYNFLQLQDFSSGQPIRYDKIRIHIPINYTFNEYQGLYLKLSVFDFFNTNSYDLANFYFDITDPQHQNDLIFSTPPLLFQEKLWGKRIEIDIPSAYILSNQRESGNAKPNTINSNLTNNVGISQTSPIFFDFYLIQNQKTINGIKTFKMSSPVQFSVPITPDFENLGVKIEPSSMGDYFEIYGTFNGTIGDFKTFIDNSVLSGKRYYVEYVITLFEENIKGKTKVYTVTDNFNVPIEERPIIKSSTTTAILDVQMNLFDQVDGSQIFRKASYGMLPNEVSKYSLNLTKINVDNISKLKIYNLKNTIQAGDDLANTELPQSFGGSSNFRIEQIKVPFPVLIEKFNIVAKSETVRVKNDIYFGNGKLQIIVYPFDNTIQFTIASDISSTRASSDPEKIIPFDLNQSADILLVFKSKTVTVESKLLLNNDGVDLVNGKVVFKIYQSQIPNIRKVYDSGVNVFYIVVKTTSGSDVVYSGTFQMWDGVENVSDMNTFASQLTDFDESGTSIANIDRATTQETALVIRQQVSNTGTTNTGTTGTAEGGGGSSDIVASLSNKLKQEEAKLKNSETYITSVIGNTIRDVKQLTSQQLNQTQRDDIVKKISGSYAQLEVIKFFDASFYTSNKNQLDIAVDNFIKTQNQKFNTNFKNDIKTI
jgi:hypothetical protein